MRAGLPDPSRYVAFAAVAGLHLLAIAGLLAMEPLQRVLASPPVVEAMLLFAPATTPEPVAPSAAVESRPPERRPPAIVEDASPVAPVSTSVDPAPQDVAPAMDMAASITTVAATSAAAPREAAPPVVDTVEYLVAPAPRYPPLARRLKEEGTVWLRVLVDAEGRAAEVSVLQSSGSPRLDEAAQRALAEARFRPYAVDGRPSAAYVRVPVEFSLRGA